MTEEWVVLDASGRPLPRTEFVQQDPQGCPNCGFDRPELASGFGPRAEVVCPSCGFVLAVLGEE